jgi:hypothetical protein
MFLPAILNVWYTQEALSVGNPMFRTLGSMPPSGVIFEAWSGSSFYLKEWGLRPKMG